MSADGGGTPRSNADHQHWDPLVSLAHAAERYGAEMIAAGGKILVAPLKGVMFAMSLDDLRRAHTRIGAAIAEYDRATKPVPMAERRAAAADQIVTVPLARGAAANGGE
jgi:hypothetical protein